MFRYFINIALLITKLAEAFEYMLYIYMCVYEMQWWMTKHFPLCLRNSFMNFKRENFLKYFFGFRIFAITQILNVLI